ncbi:MAG: HD domain-containing protein [bacterium]
MPPTGTEKLLGELREGDHFTGFVAIRRLESRQKKDGSPFLVVEFSDRSGRLPGKIWEQVEEFKKILEVGQVVKLAGTITTFQDKPEIHIERLRPINPEDPVDRSRIIPTSERTADEMRRHLRRLIEGIRHPQLRQFLRRFFDDPEISEAYFQAPGGKQWHHAYVGGLAEHSLNIAEILLKVVEFYPHANSDLLVAGALLHDVGKIQEFNWDVTVDYSDRGRLIGHIVLGQELLASRRQLEPGLDDEIWKNLMHLVLSHQGSGEQGSPVVPMTLEAILLHHADEMDSKANAFNRIIQRSREKGDSWTEWVTLMNRYLYSGGKITDSQEDQQDTLF